MIDRKAGQRGAAFHRLIARGVTLLPPAGPADWDRLEGATGLEPGQDFRAVTAQFDGFLVHDPASMLMLWSIDQIIAQQETNRNGVIAIGDFLLESDLIVAAIADEQACVTLLHENRVLAPSITAFIARIASGEFDWLA